MNKITSHRGTSIDIAQVHQLQPHMEGGSTNAPLNRKMRVEIFFPIYKSSPQSILQVSSFHFL